MHSRGDRVKRGIVGLLCVAAAWFLPAEATERKSAFVGDVSPNELERKGEAPPGPTRYARSSYLWPYATGPYYGDVPFRERREAGVIRTRVGSFRLDREARPFPRELTATNALESKSRQYFIVQIRPETLEEEGWATLYAKIRDGGGEVVRHLPVAAVLARLTPAAYAALLETADLIALEPYHPALKLNPAIGRTPLLDPRKALSEEYSLDVVLHPGEPAGTVVDAVIRLGGRVTRQWRNRLRIELPTSRLAELASLDEIAAIDEYVPPLPQDQKITNAIQTGAINGNANPFHDAGIRGAGQVLMVLDTGIQLDAGDLSDSATSPGTPGPSHRKVRFYGTTDPFGGRGDELGCDAAIQGGFTHGHGVSAVALGNPVHEGETFRATDAGGAPWALTGVAPDALLVAYDAYVTPVIGTCQDSLLGVLDVGQLYDPDPNVRGSLDHAFELHDARTFNFSWGSNTSVYTVNAAEVDAFLFDYPGAVLFAAVGNGGRDSNYDSRPDPGTVGEPATAKNVVAVGSHKAPDDFGDRLSTSERSFTSGVGPVGATGRIAPLLMAPGEDEGQTGPRSVFACRTADNPGSGPVVCDVASARSGTSYASAAAAGAALLVRDYFAQGFYPDGTSRNPGNDADLVPEISGALTKAILVGSAEFLGRSFRGTRGYYTYVGNGWFFTAPDDNLTMRHRFNIEQGYGRIQLDKALPLASWSAGPTGIRVVDGGIADGVNGFAGTELSGMIDAVGGESQSATFEICDDSQELRIALVWYDDPGDALINDLDLKLIGPDGKLYLGNYFTDDDNRDGVIERLLEDCPSTFDDGTPNDDGLDRSAWSLPACTRPGDGVSHPPSLSPPDATNPVEAIFLSPNPEGRVDAGGEPVLRTGRCSDATAAFCGHDGHCAPGVSCIGGTSQVRAGTHSLVVTARAGGTNHPFQRYALVVIGGLCDGSSAAFDRPSYVCFDEATITITESDEASDPAAALDAELVGGRTVVEVLSPDGGTVRDRETGGDLGLTRRDPGGLQFVADDVVITDGTSYDPGNGVLDARAGDLLRVTYLDESIDGVGGDPEKVRVAEARVDCSVDLVTSTRFSMFGMNAASEVVGGCERNARGLFEFGYPDRYMDAQESVAYRIALASAEHEPLERVTAELSCVVADADSPADCAPQSDACPDPRRENNPPCTDLTILDPYQVIGLIDPLASISVNFQIRMSDSIVGSPEVEMLLRVTADQIGKNRPTLIVNRHRLNVDEVTLRYSTDFPGGGTLTVDRNNDGLIENPVSTGITGFPTSNNTDYRFETVLYSDLTQGTDAGGAPVVVNDGIQAPWNFDTNDGGFTTGIAAGTDDALISEMIAQWGEDKNFNNRLDGRCRSRHTEDCDRFDLDPLHCGFCDAASSNRGDACTLAADCPGGSCDFTCINFEDRDPVNFPVALLDQNWSTRGGCGWQTKAPGTCSGDASVGCYNDADCGASGACTGPAPATGGIWHTGRIGNTTETDCVAVGDAPAQCQIYETIGGLEGRLAWFELLVTPELTKVNQAVDPGGAPLATAEIEAFSFNWAVDLPDNNVSVTWEFDNDTERLEPVDLKSDFTVLVTSTGDYGAINGGGNPFLTRGWGLFAPINPVTGQTRNGTVGNNRVGRNSCFFENGAIPEANLDYVFTGLPPDDDLNEGYCPSGQGRGGMDPHLNYCTLVCSGRPGIACGADPDCGIGICDATEHCSHNPEVPCYRICLAGAATGEACSNDAGCDRCIGGSRDGRTCNFGCPGGECSTGGVCSETADAACDLGTCVDIVCNGSCIAGACSNGTPGECAGDADCAEACVFTNATIDEYVTPNGPVRAVELNDYNGPDMRFTTLLDIFAKRNRGIPPDPDVPFFACGGAEGEGGMPPVWRERSKGSD